ncbi:GNAT family N-acetyltransferase [Actinoplanes sp. NPDC051513]|uniref:GNAT family N-acetyltransferase n=1 Tax=Actinoplanes sp. NPDC051513 TaxID=3363908 RepID=UPI0037AD6472
MIVRATTAADLDRVLAWTVEAPVSWVAADTYHAEAAERRYRPEWTWIAEDEAGRLLARAVWWGRTDSERPAVLDCLSVAESVVDPVPVAADLLDTAHSAFGILPLYQVKLAMGWADDPRAAAAVAWRREAAHAAGLTHEVQRLQYEWSPADGVPAPSGRLVFKPEPDDAVMLEMFRRIAAGSLDAETRRNLAAVGATATARKELAFYLAAPGDRAWWRLAYTPEGELAGLAIPSATPYGPNVGYLGVLPELRGNGYVDDILAEVTRVHAERGATRITATTDVGNAPMAAAFGRAGYRDVQARIVLSAPAQP